MTEQHQRFLCSHLALIIIPSSVGREMGCAVHDDGDHGSSFFLSYARTRGNSAGAGDPDEYVQRFFDDLTENVDVLIHLPAAVPVGFLDRGMEGGMLWTDELIRAVGTCQVLIALLSVGYLNSEWCRMEWYAFEQRRVHRLDGSDAPPTQGCIIPVIWAPFPSSLPEHISTRLIFSPTHEPNRNVPGHYRKNGIFGLMRMGELKTSYEIVTWQLAMLIASIYHCQRTEPREFELAELRRCLPG